MIYGYIDLEHLKVSFVQNWSEYKLLNNKGLVKNFKTEVELNNWSKLVEKKVKLKEFNEPQNYIYCDSGTAFGEVEVRVTNHLGYPLIEDLIDINYLNSRGNLCVGQTNNYGELMGSYLAMKLILEVPKYAMKNILCDSAIVVFFWLINEFHNLDVNYKYINFLRSALELYLKFSSLGLEVGYIPREFNPADLRYEGRY